MRILYIASGIPVPGSLGGSTHALEVGQGLGRRGHELHLVAAPSRLPRMPNPAIQPVSSPEGVFQLYHQMLPKAGALLGAAHVLRLARKLRPDAIMERYYNFAGSGVIAARRLGIPCLLEVNALMVDPPGTRKDQLDRLSGGWMRRWAVQQCRWSDAIVTPLHTTVPAEIDRDKICELPWGANVAHFAAPAERAVDLPPTAIFLGSFRAWHGVLDFVRAAVLLLEQGKPYHFLLVGDGPERAQAEALAARYHHAFTFTGSLTYERIPAALQRAHVGVAPFNTNAHIALQHAGFFWSPLKVFEYMASNLPVITADIPPLNTIVRHGIEGILVPEQNPPALARALIRLLDQPSLALAMGRLGRQRVVARYSWDAHCAGLETILTTLSA